MASSPLVEQVARALFDHEWGGQPGLADEWRSGREYWLGSAQAALAVLQPLLDERGWRSIESAPKDGDFLAWNRMTGVYVTRQQDGEFPMHGWDGKEGVWYPRPSHWMPLPEPPESKEPK